MVGLRLRGIKKNEKGGRKQESEMDENNQEECSEKQETKEEK